VEDCTGMSHLCAARSANGVDGWIIDPRPTLAANPREFPEEIWGIEDPRITYVPELEKYAVAYTSFSRGGPGVSLAMTADFVNFERFGVIMQPEDKDAALLPRRIGNYWALIHRPVTTLGAHMWISYSPDLHHWGSHKIMLEARRGGWWDANKIGLCSPPIETAKGWLTIYHGVRNTASGSIYRLGLALFDLEKPELCLQRGDCWMFGPEAPMSEAETSAMLSSLAGKRSPLTATPFISTTGRQTPVWLSQPAVFALCLRGWRQTPAWQRQQAPNCANRLRNPRAKEHSLLGIHWRVW
jgi:predicted GH43/DUF377 family glycosyl hydrolase